MKHLVHIPGGICCAICNPEPGIILSKTQFLVKLLIHKCMGYYKTLELTSFGNLYVNINLIINFIYKNYTSE